MKKLIIIVFLLIPSLLFAGSVQFGHKGVISRLNIDSTSAFRFEVKTAEADTFQLPLVSGGTYDFHVDWGDSSSSDITVYNHADTNHSYSGAGTYDVVITGTITGWEFNNGGDKTLIYDISEWGPLAFGNLNDYHFYGCSNLTISATDAPNLTGTESLLGTFRSCTSITTIDVSEWDTSDVDDMRTAFRYLNSLTSLDLSGLDISSLTKAEDMLMSTTLPTSDYDDLLVSWSAQAATAAYIFSGGNSKYTQTSVDSGTTDGTTSDKLVQSGQNFETTVTVNDIVHNTTDDTYAKITVIDSNTTLSLSVDIMISGETFVIQSSAAAKARQAWQAKGWTITDGGPE